MMGDMKRSGGLHADGLGSEGGVAEGETRLVRISSVDLLFALIMVPVQLSMAGYCLFHFLQ